MIFWRDGINLTHRISDRFQKTIDDLAADRKAKLDPALEKELNLLSEAVRLNKDNTPVSETAEAKGIQVGNRILYPEIKRPYGEKLLAQLKALEEKLKTRPDEKAFHKKVKGTLAALDNYLNKKTRWIELKDLQGEWEKIESAQKDLQSEGSKNGLDGHEDWKALQRTFSGKKGELQNFHKRVENTVQLAAIFQTDKNEFQDKWKTPDEALKTFQEAKALIKKAEKKGETWYLSYIYSLDENVESFISQHTPPQMNKTEAKPWEAAVAEAKKLFDPLP